MALIDKKTRKFLQEKLAAELTRPVKVELFTGAENPETVKFATDLLVELGELSPAITHEIKPLDGAGRDLGLQASPTLVVGRDLGYRIEYWGAPLGHEAEGFIDTLVMVSRGEHGLNKVAAALAAKIEKETRAYSFVTPTCPFCPKAVMLNHKLAVAAPGRVRSICVEAQENMELSRKYNVSSVPQQLFDEDLETVTIGVQPEVAYVRALLKHGGTTDAALDELVTEAKGQASKLPDDPGVPVEVTDDNFQAAIAKYPALVVDCWAEWCGPCRMVGPVVEALAGELKGTVVFGKLDTEANQETASELQITSIPTLLLYKDGKLVDRLVGFRPKPAMKKEIQQRLFPV